MNDKQSNHRAAKSLEEVLAEFLYTDDNMFLDIKYEAEEELYRRIPPPVWAGKHPLPFMAEPFWGKDVSQDE